MARRPHSYESQFINATWRKADSFAKILSEAGRRVALLSVPLTYPPEQINGVVISGFDAPGIGGVADASAIHPPGLRSTLRQVVGEYPISANLEALSGGVRSEEHTSELQSQSNLVCRLLLEKKKRMHMHRVGVRNSSTRHT